MLYSETIEGLALSEANRTEANRTELNTSSSRRTVLGLFYYFCVFFVKSSVRFDRTELQNELNMMHSSDEDIELCSVDRTELFTKKHKNNQKICKSSGTVRRDKIELVRLSSVRFGSVRFGSVRFENLLKLDSFTIYSPERSKL